MPDPFRFLLHVLDGMSVELQNKNPFTRTELLELSKPKSHITY